MVSSFDGTAIAARRVGAGPRLPVLVANAAGATLGLWRAALAGIAAVHPVLSWDHRGLHASGVPASERRDPRAHALDALAAADGLGARRFSIASWSNGARVALELATFAPERVAGLALVCGGYANPLERLLKQAEASSVLPLVAAAARRLSPVLQGPFRSLTSRPELGGLIRHSGLVGPTADSAALAELLRAMSACDLDQLLRCYESLAGAGESDALDSVRAPTLLIAGERDRFTSLRAQEQMLARIRGSTLKIYPRATHYLPIEFPAALRLDLEVFLERLH